MTFQDTMASYVSGSEPMPVTAIAAIIQHNTSGIISMKDKGITGPAQMAGHTYACLLYTSTRRRARPGARG